MHAKGFLTSARAGCAKAIIHCMIPLLLKRAYTNTVQITMHMVADAPSKPLPAGLRWQACINCVYKFHAWVQPASTNATWMGTPVVRARLGVFCNTKASVRAWCTAQCRRQCAKLVPIPRSNRREWPCLQAQYAGLSNALG